MGLQLTPLEDGPKIYLNRPIIFIGRHADCDVRIDSKKISRRHCSIIQINKKDEGSQVIIRDLGSTNGIYHEGQRIEEAVIAVGSNIQIADLRYKLERYLPPPADGEIAKPTALADDDPVPFNELQNPSDGNDQRGENQ